MAENSKIEWTDATWNPTRGCSRVSPGCDNCYAMSIAYRFSGVGKPFEGLAQLRNGKPDWTGSARLVPDKLKEPLRWRKPKRVFVDSMSDLFHHSLSNEDIAAVFGVMAACPRHTFQVLTKRPERARKWFEWCAGLESDLWTECHYQALQRDDETEFMHRKSGGDPTRPWPLPNVWLGTSVENQECADKRIPELLQCPAAVRFLSCEPLLGPLDLRAWLAIYAHDGKPCCTRRTGYHRLNAINRLDWVIVGGESGPGARPFDVAWARVIRDQCKAAGVACFVKQLGAHILDSNDAGFDGDPDDAWPGVAVEMGEFEIFQGAPARVRLNDRKGGDPSEWPEDLRVREFPF